MDNPKTVKVRVAVAVGPDGYPWNCKLDCGDDKDTLQELSNTSPRGAFFVWITADVPLPAVPEAAAVVESPKAQGA